MLKAIAADAAASMYFSAAAIELRAAEIKHGVTLIEAVAVDAFQCELLAVTAPEDESARADLRRMTIELAKLGVRSDEDVDGMVRLWHTARTFGLSVEDVRTVGALMLRLAARS